jgi:xanthine dehydrogenase iron-sulfur cluster and FAD-binding subunit A
MRLIISLDGMSITTVEGMGSHMRGYHPIQQKIAQDHGTQCGYCTPGFVTQMVSLQEDFNAVCHSLTRNSNLHIKSRWFGSEKKRKSV